MKNKVKKILCALLLGATLTAGILSSYVYADFGSGVAVLSEGAKITKSALAGKKIVFSDVDFKQGLCISDFEKIKITAIPLSTEGTLMLAGRRVGEGTTIKRKNIGALVFIPASEEVKECKFTFTTEDFADGAPVEFILKFTDKVNYEPKIVKAESEAASLSTQREVSLYGKMNATDDEGDEIEYVIISYPKAGILKVLDKNTGEYRYTPPADYVGEVSFTYTALDEWGNYSTPEKVTITVSERLTETVYADMSAHKDYNAALALTAAGIMDGRLIGDGIYFMPDDNVTIAEFVTMAMKSAGISPKENLTESFFDDNADIPLPLRSYVATAQSLGIIQGEFKNNELLLRPNDKITGYEAALVLSKIINTDISPALPVFASDISVPVWAKSSVGVMCALGIFDAESAASEVDKPITKAECASYLYKMMSLAS